MNLKKTYISNILLGFFLLALVYYVFKNASDFKLLLQVDIYLLLIVFLLRTIQLILGGVFILKITNLFLEEKKLRLYESFYISVFSAVGNFFSFLQGGIGIRALYLKDKYNLSLMDFSTTIIIHYMILFFIYGSAGLLSLFLLGNGAYYIIIPMFFLSYGMIFVLFFINFFFTYSFIKERSFSFIKKGIVSLKEIPKIVAQNRSLFLYILFLYFLRFVLACTIQYWLFMSVDIGVEKLNLLLYTSIAGLSIIINLTPASIGFRESLFFLTEESLGLSTSEILNLAIIDRTMLIVVLVVWFFTLRYINTKKKCLKIGS